MHDQAHKIGHSLRGYLQKLATNVQLIADTCEDPENKERANYLLGVCEDVGKTLTQLLEEVTMRTPSLRSLVVEDDESVKQGWIRALLKQGHKIVGHATSGRAMIDMALLHKPDLILFDIGLSQPIPNGLTALAEIVNEIPDVMGVAVTGNQSFELIQQAMDGGWVFNYLLKPVTDQQLNAAINVAYSKWKQVQVLKEENIHLKVDLAEAKTVNQAKHIVMKRAGISEDQAFRWMRTQAMELRLKIAEIARLVNVGEM